MTSSMAAGSNPDRRTASCSTVVASTSAGVLTNEPLNDVPMAVRTALTMTGLGMSSTFGMSGCAERAAGIRDSNGISYRSNDDNRGSGGGCGCAFRVETGQVPAFGARGGVEFTVDDRRRVGRHRFGEGRLQLG